MQRETTDSHAQADPAKDGPLSEDDSRGTAVRARRPSSFTRRSLLRAGSVAVVGSVAGCAASERNDPDTSTDEPTPTEGGRGVSASGGVNISNETDVAIGVSVDVVELDEADHDALPRAITPTTPVEARSPVFRTRVQLSPDARRYYRDVFPAPDDRVAYRATVTLEDGTTAGYDFGNYPHSGFIALSVRISDEYGIIVGKSVA